MSMFKKKQNAIGSVPKVLAWVDEQLNRSSTASFVPPAQVAGGLGLESLDQLGQQDLERQINSFGVGLESALTQIASSSNTQFTVAQRESAKIGAVIGSNVHAWARAERPSFGKGEAVNGATTVASIAMEGYDDRNNKTTARYTTAYNLYAPRQDVFGETLFPTVTIAPDQPGFTSSIDLTNIIDNMRRNTTGDTDKYGRRNIIHALRDPSILRSDATAVVGVYRDSNKKIFVPEAVLAPRTVKKNGETITTSPYAFGIPAFSLLGNSQTDGELAVAEQNQTDVLDTAIRLKKVYLQVGAADSTEVIAFDTTSIAGSTFNEAVQDDDRKMVLNLNLTDLIINKNTVLANGGALASLDAVKAGDFMVRLQCKISADVILDLSDISAMASAVSVVEIIDQAGEVHTPDSAAVAAIAALFAEMRMIGYEVEARRINSNRRTIAQILESRIYNQNYAIPRHAPYTIQRPQTAGEQNDSAAVNSLVQACRALTQAAAVYKLLETDQILASAVDKRRNIHTVTQLMGPVRLITTPFYERHTVSVVNTMASIKSHEVAADARAVLVNLIRDVAFRAHRDSGLQIALDAAYGGAAPKPVVILATDQYTEQYLHVTGDLRTLADKFDVKIVSTPMMDMYGKIFLTFGNFDPALEGQPNPYHFGNMAWCPETVLAFPTAREGQTSVELTVAPSFLHIVNLPILARIDVEGLSEAMTTKPVIGFQEKP